MKIFRLLFVLYLLSACNNSIDKDYDFLFRKWEISDRPSITIQKINGQIVTTKNSVLCNVCPTIIFNKNQTGYVENPGKQRFPFSWDIKKNKLLFKNFIKNGSVPIDDGEYIIAYDKVKLELTNRGASNNKIFKYILR